MKVIINSAIGGFSYSYEAMKELIKRGSIAIEVLPITAWGDRAEETKKEFSFDIGDGFFADSEFESSAILKGDTIYCTDWSEIAARTDLIAIVVVEELKERAFTKGGQLKIVEIPDGIKFKICSGDDGREWIAEEHRTWA